MLAKGNLSSRPLRRSGVGSTKHCGPVLRQGMKSKSLDLADLLNLGMSPTGLTIFACHCDNPNPSPQNSQTCPKGPHYWKWAVTE